MSILRTLEQRGVERRGANGALPWGDTTPPSNGMLGSPVAGTAVSEKTALQLAAVYGSVGVLADAVSTLPLGLLNSVGPVRKQLPPSPLITKPFSEISLIDWLTQFTISLALRGNFFGQIVERDPNLYPTQIKPVHPDDARVRRLPSGAVEYRYFGRVVKPADVFHVRYLSSAGALAGLNPIEYLRNTFGLARAAELYGGSFFSNSAMPSGTIEVEGDLDEDETQALAASWRQMHQGIGQANLPAVLTGGATFKPITINPDDAQFLESRQFSQSEIAGMIFRIPPHMIGIVDRTTSWGCLPAETLVFTSHGPKPIADVQEGEQVWSLGERGMELRKVVGWQMTGAKPLLTFRTRGRTVRATPNHHMIVRRWSAPGRQGRGVKGRWETLMVDARDVRVGDYFIIPHGFGDGDLATAPTGRGLTVGAMELAGLYFGDGSRDKNRVEIAHAVDEDHMPHYRQVIRDEFGVEPYTDKGGYRTRFSSAEAVEFLTDFMGTALTKRVPEWVFRLAPEFQLAFLRGYLDSDGSVQHGTITYSSASRALLEDVRHLCILAGVPVAQVIMGRKAGTMRVKGQRAYHAQPKWQLSLASKPYNSLIGSNSPHKSERLVATPTKRRLRYDPGASPQCTTPITDGLELPGIVFHRVTKIEESKLLVPVYDIEVEGNHSFIADGVLVSNTGIEQQEMGFVRNTLSGYLRRLELALTELHPPNEYARFNMAHRMRGDKLSRYQAYSLGILGGWLCADDIRAEEDMGPVPGGIGKTFLLPINTEPLKLALQGTLPQGPAQGPAPVQDPGTQAHQ